MEKSLLQIREQFDRLYEYERILKPGRARHKIMRAAQLNKLASICDRLGIKFHGGFHMLSYARIAAVQKYGAETPELVEREYNAPIY